MTFDANQPKVPAWSTFLTDGAEVVNPSLFTKCRSAASRIRRKSSWSLPAQSRLPATFQMLRRSFCIAATHAQRSIFLAATPVCQTKLPLTANEVHIASLP
jgi:hypothetical protein